MENNKKKNIITITGKIGAGKTEIVKKISEILNMQTYSGSETFRKLARKQNMTINEFNEYVKDNPKIDREIDDATAEHIKDKNNIIIDARLGWYIVPESFKVYVKVNLDNAAKRIIEDSINRGKEEEYENELVAKNSIIIREHFEKVRYLKEYKVDISDEKHYDLIIDTTNILVEDAAIYIIKKYKDWKEKKK